MHPFLRKNKVQADLGRAAGSRDDDVERPLSQSRLEFGQDSARDRFNELYWAGSVVLVFRSSMGADEKRYSLLIDKVQFVVEPQYEIAPPCSAGAAKWCNLEKGVL